MDLKNKSSGTQFPDTIPATLHTIQVRHVMYARQVIQVRQARLTIQLSLDQDTSKTKYLQGKPEQDILRIICCNNTTYKYCKRIKKF